MAPINANKNSPRFVKGYLDVSCGLAEVPLFPVKTRKSAKRVGGRGWCAKTHTGLGVNGYVVGSLPGEERLASLQVISDRCRPGPVGDGLVALPHPGVEGPARAIAEAPVQVSVVAGDVDIDGNQVRRL